MRKNIIKLFAILAVLLLTACNNQYTNFQDTENYIVAELNTFITILDTAQCETDIIISAFQHVLQNERPFYSRWAGLDYLNNYNSDLEEPTSITIFDMNGDGIPEVIVNFNNSIKLVLHYYNGEIFGTEFGIRDINAISTDGRFFLSPGGAGSFGIGELIIAGEIADILTIYSFDAVWKDRHYPYETHINLLNGVSISDEEFEIWYASLTEKEFITWHSFTQENIQNLALLTTPRYLSKEHTDTINTTTMHIDEDIYNGNFMYIPNVPIVGLGEEFLLSRLVGSEIRQHYITISDDNRVYEFVSTHETSDDSWWWFYEAWVFVSVPEYPANGTYRYLYSFEINERLGNASGGVVLADINFDGTKDVLVMQGMHGNQGFSTYEAFLRHGDKYIRVAFDFPNPSINVERERIGSFIRNWAASHTWQMYAFEDGKFVLTDSFDTDMDRNTWEDIITIGFLEDGVWVYREYRGECRDELIATILPDDHWMFPSGWEIIRFNK